MITNPPYYDYSTLSHHIHLHHITFRKIDMTTKNSGGFIRFSPLFRGADDTVSVFLKIFFS